MGQSRITLLLLCIAFSSTWAAEPSSALAASSGILTNAEGGLFASARTFWFSVPANERLILAINGQESYRGFGPTSLELSAVPASVTEYELIAERRSAPPESVLLESRNFLVVIDAEPPQSPAFSVKTAEDGSWILSYSVEKRARVDAVVDSGGKRELYRDLINGQRFPSGTLSILAWSVDAASNCSQVISPTYKPLSLNIRNPVEGTWNNKQRLYLEVQDATSVFWTLDGTDPLGASGRIYSDGILLDGTGKLTLKVACRSEDGRILRSESTFTVTEKAAPQLATLAAAEINPILSETFLTIPSGYRWDSSGTSPIYPNGKNIQLKPQNFIQRPYTLVVGNAEGTWRYLYRLGGDEKNKQEPAPETPGKSMAENSPQVLQTGSTRLILWPKNAGHIRYRLVDTKKWQEANAPVFVSDEGINLEWISETGPQISESQQFLLPPILTQNLPIPVFPMESISNKKQSFKVESDTDLKFNPGYYLSYSLGGDSVSEQIRYTSPSFPLQAVSNEELVFDACDGEEITWNLTDRREKELSFTIDKRKPLPPEFKAPGELSWVSGAVDFSCTTEVGAKLQTRVFNINTEGKEELLQLERANHIPAPSSGPQKISIQAWSEDRAGNISEVVKRSFIMDIPTVYVREKANGSEKTVASPDGSREHPFESLGLAIDFAQSEKIPLIRLSGSFALKGAHQIQHKLQLVGAYDSGWNQGEGTSSVAFEADAALTVQGNLEINNLRFKGILGSKPLITLEKGSSCRIVDSELYADLSSQRSLALGAKSGALTLERSKIELGGTSPFVTGIESSFGTLTLRSSSILVHAKNSAFCLTLRGTRLDAENSTLEAVASDYASTLDADSSALFWKAGSLSAHSRDVVLVLLSNTEATFSDTRLIMDATFAARSVDVRGAPPSFRGGVFKSIGSSLTAMALAGTEPKAASIASNKFMGFAYLWEKINAGDDLSLFNRRFAPLAEPNEIVEVGGEFEEN